MNPGQMLLQVSLIAAITSAVLFLPALRGRKSPLGPWAFGLHALALIGAMGFLAAYFLSHRFEFVIVAQYSSRALSPALSLAALWAGQEGSLLLWSVIAAVIGVALLRQPGALSRPALFFVSATQAAMLVLVLVRSPFRTSAVIPADGQGLNPLLEDPWMVAHPPALFVGYAALLVPSALAMAALVRREYRDWNRVVWPWALFAVVTLGIGIALGGIWAYKVLGWGGYWGWDPVENASLVPWLAAVALLHGLLIQRITGAVTRTNLLLSMLGWVLVLAGTYLTRSGALQDFSVHSFADSGLKLPLTALLAGTFLVSATLLGVRWRSIASAPTNWMSVSREAALWLGMITVLVLMVLVAFGTASPLVTSLFGAPASVRASFYENVSVPLAVVVLLLIAVAPALRWARQQGAHWLRDLMPGLLVGILTAALAYALGLRGMSRLGLAGLAAFALVVNGIVTVRHFRRGWVYGAGYLGHLGIAVMVLGMVLSAALGRTDRLKLPQHQTVRSLGYTLAYRGEEIDGRGRRVLRVRVEKPGFAFDARPRLYPSPQGEGVVREPALARHGELYVSAMEILPAQTHTREPVWLQKGRETQIGDATFTFAGFHMESGGHLRVMAELHVRRADRTDRVTPGMEVGPSGTRSLDAELAGIGRIALARIDADHQRVAVALPWLTAAPAIAIVDFSTKPLINLVWIGALIAVLGTGLAGVRRAQERTPLRGTAHGPKRRAVSPVVPA